MRVEAKKNESIQEEEEKEENRYFPTQYTEFKEEDRQKNEQKALKWMDVEIKTKEVYISIDDHPTLAKIGDYCIEEQTAKILNVSKEY
jgi:hypothetical protein